MHSSSHLMGTAPTPCGYPGLGNIEVVTPEEPLWDPATLQARMNKD